jgi:putative DNA primase/helicase
MLDGAVRLMPPKPRFGLAEGVETAIAAALLNRGTSVWATCGASRLGSVAIPEGVETVVLFGDRGENGEELAYQAAAKYERKGYLVAVAFPREGFDDFNTQLLADRLGRIA